MIKRQQCTYQDCRQSDDALPHDPAMLGGLMLRAALDFDLLISRNMGLSRAIETMQQRDGIYHPELLKVLASMHRIDRSMEIRAIYIKDLVAGMVADENILTTSGLLLIAKGQEVNHPMIERLHSFSKTTDIIEPFRMRI